MICGAELYAVTCILLAFSVDFVMNVEGKTTSLLELQNYYYLWLHEFLSPFVDSTQF